MAKRTTLVGTLLFCAGCFYPLERGRLLEERIDQGDAKLNQTLPKIDQKIAEVTKALDGLDKASRRSGADIGVQLQKNVEDVAQLRGQIDSFLHSVQELDQKLAALQTAVDQKLAAFQSEETKREAEAQKQARPADKKQLFALAEQKASGGEAVLARQLFREFVKKWPHDDLTGEAYFQLGETYYAEKSCDQALPEYGKVVLDFAHSKSAPAALLRSSDCFKALGKIAESRSALEEVVRTYPKSEAAKVAKSKLAPAAKPSKAPPKKPSK